MAAVRWPPTGWLRVIVGAADGLPGGIADAVGVPAESGSPDRAPRGSVCG